jgi:hypothetical protein
MKSKRTKKVSAAKIASDRAILESLYAQFEAAQASGNAAEEDRLSEELLNFAFNPDYEVKL